MWGFILRLLPKVYKLAPIVGAYGCVALAGFTLGAWLTHTHYQTEMDEQALAMAKAQALQGKREHERIVNLTDELDQRKRTVVDLRDELERVRVARAKREAATPVRVDQASDARSAELLERGAELVERCGRLLQSNALTHDALSKAVSP